MSRRMISRLSFVVFAAGTAILAVSCAHQSGQARPQVASPVAIPLAQSSSVSPGPAPVTPYVIMTRLPDPPKAASPSRRALHLTRQGGHYYLQDSTGQLYAVGRDSHGNLYPVYQNPTTHQLYPLYYDSARNQYYYVLEDQGVYYRTYDDDSRHWCYPDPNDYADYQPPAADQPEVYADTSEFDSCYSSCPVVECAFFAIDLGGGGYHNGGGGEKGQGAPPWLKHATPARPARVLVGRTIGRTGQHGPGSRGKRIADGAAIPPAGAVASKEDQPALPARSETDGMVSQHKVIANPPVAQASHQMRQIMVSADTPATSVTLRRSPGLPIAMRTASFQTQIGATGKRHTAPAGLTAATGSETPAAHAEARPSRPERRLASAIEAPPQSQDWQPPAPRAAEPPMGSRSNEEVGEAAENVGPVATVPEQGLDLTPAAQPSRTADRREETSTWSAPQTDQTPPAPEPAQTQQPVETHQPAPAQYSPPPAPSYQAPAPEPERQVYQPAAPPPANDPPAYHSDDAQPARDNSTDNSRGGRSR